MGMLTMTTDVVNEDALGADCIIDVLEHPLADLTARVDEFFRRST